ncbi:MAG: hypothetical protein ACE5IO_08395 [Thermoplasmata archaeon]
MNEQDSMKDVSTSEVLLGLLDNSESWLNRLTKYAGRIFFLVFLFLILLSAFIGFTILELRGHFEHITTLGLITEVLVWTVFIVYWYMYYKIKGENDAWKARIKELKKREEVFLMGR